MTISTLNKATATQYQFALDAIPVSANTIHALDVLRLNIFSINVPGITLDQAQMFWRGNHSTIHEGGITFDQLTLNFIVDDKFGNWKILFKWLTGIANNKDRATSPAMNYVANGALLLMDNWNNIVVRVKFKSIWITSLGEMMFSIRDGETHIECSATFAYDYYEIE